VERDTTEYSRAVQTFLQNTAIVYRNQHSSKIVISIYHNTECGKL
jgi:hypothetical protein